MSLACLDMAHGRVHIIVGMGDPRITRPGGVPHEIEKAVGAGLPSRHQMRQTRYEVGDVDITDRAITELVSKLSRQMDIQQTTLSKICLSSLSLLGGLPASIPPWQMTRASRSAHWGNRMALRGTPTAAELTGQDVTKLPPSRGIRQRPTKRRSYPHEGNKFSRDLTHTTLPVTCWT